MKPSTINQEETTVNKSAVMGTIFGITVATAVAGIAGYSLSDRDTGSPMVAQEDCYEVQVEQGVAPRDERRITGTVIGALVGGAVGKDIGDRDLTTAAGAAVGAVAGNQVQKKIQESATSTTTEIRCVPSAKGP
jgi:uncharacterized protein YcfJ